MTKYRSRKDGSHFPISKRRAAGTYQTGTAHLGVPRRFGKKTVTLKSSGQYSDEVYYRGKLVGSVRKLSNNEYLVAGKDSSEEFNPQTHVFKTQYEAINALIMRKNKVSKKEYKVEVAMVKDEAEGEAKYLKMADEADKEGRHEDAETYRAHAAQEHVHKIEDKAIVQSEKLYGEWFKSPRTSTQMEVDFKKYSEGVKKPLAIETKIIDGKEYTRMYYKPLTPNENWD